MLILAVDDDPDSLEMLTSLLRSQSATVVGATSAVEALEVLQKEAPNVVVSDIAMPDHDGYWLMEQLRRLAEEGGPAVPCVALTAFANATVRERALSTGFVAHLSKPFDPDQLVHTLRNAVAATATLASVFGLQQPAGFRVLRISEHLDRSALFHHDALGQHDNTRRKLRTNSSSCDVITSVRPALRQRCSVSPRSLRRAGSSDAVGSSSKQQRRIDGQGARDRDALRLAARQLARQRRGAMADTELIEQARGRACGGLSHRHRCT